jgi:hypothetical protein
MKRWIVILTITLIGLLSGCSSGEMDMDPDYEPTEIYFDDYVVFSWNTMTFTDVSEYDILYQIGTPVLDYFIAYNNAGLEGLSTNQLNAYQTTIESIVILDQSTSFRLADLDTYTSTEFVSFLTDAGIDISPTKLFTFATLQEQAETREFQSVRLTKREYIEDRLSRALTIEEVTALSSLQEYYVQLKAVEHSNYDISQDSFQQLLSEIEGELNTVLTSEEQTELETAYNIIQELIE